MTSLVSHFTSPLTRVNLLVLRRVCLTSLSHFITALIWTAVVVHVIAQRTPRVWARVAPVLARLVQAVALRLDPATAPLFQPITAADIDAMTRDRLFVTLNKPAPVVNPNEWVSVGDVLYTDLKRKTMAQLRRLAGVNDRSRNYTKDQLIARIQLGPAQSSEVF